MTTAEITTLKQLCTELKLDLREARERLRDATTYPELEKTDKPRGPWQWAKNAPAEAEARRLLATKQN